MRPSAYTSLKPKILELRQQGLSYSQIKASLGVNIPQSTLSSWCSGVSLSPEAQAVLRKRMSGDPYRVAMVKLLAKERRQARRDVIKNENMDLKMLLDENEVAKVALVMLYLGEGSKTDKGCVYFANSNPGIIRLFLKMFLSVYQADISKFRITVQCRADQNTSELEEYWEAVIGIADIRFYKTKIDPRTVGIPTKKSNYMGVCRIDYFDAKIQLELLTLGDYLCMF